MAYGHGGARPGAGAKPGGVSQLRRTLNGAILDGLERAGRERGLAGDKETVAREAAARIVSDMILAGRGEEVLKLGAVIAPKVSGDDQVDDDDSPVLAALRRMPGMVAGHNSSRLLSVVESEPAESGTCDQSTTDCESGGREEQAPSEHHQVQVRRPFFAPQIPLLPAELGGPVRAAGACAAPPRPAPHPPAPAPLAPLYPATAPLEKSENEVAA